MITLARITTLTTFAFAIALALVATAPAYAAPGTEHEWQCGKVNVKTYLSESPSEYIIPSFHMKYVVTGIDKANNRFDLNGDGLYLDGKLCWPIKPLTCLRPDGTEESCDKRQTPLPTPRPADAPQAIPIPKTVLYDEPGGYLHLYEERFRKLAGSGDEVEIRGTCPSACTTIMAHIPRERLCFGDYASLQFHLARDGNTQEPSIEASRYMYSHYPQDIRIWLANKGGVDRMPYFGMWTLEATELWEMGYRKCAYERPAPMITRPALQQYRPKWETAVEVEERERKYWRKRDERAEKAYRDWIEVHK
jgi:hypothetical protein